MMFTAVTIGVAHASAGSGRIYRGSPNGTYNVCAQAWIYDTADNVAETISQDWNTGCWNDNDSQSSGWLGAKALGYRDGGYCGSTGWYYNSVSTWKFAVGAYLCSNPSGTQVFKTKADSRAWDDGENDYDDYLQVQSPNQNY